MLTLTALRAHLPGKSTVIIAATVSVLGVLAARSWLASHDDAVRLAASLQAQNRVVAQADEREHQRDASLATALAQINAARKRVNTPAQAATAIPQVLPPLPEPIALRLPAPTPQLPDAPATDPLPHAIAAIPQADLLPIYDYLQDCRACQASLNAARDNLTDEHAKLAAVTTERDSAIRAARGGNLWSRLRHNAKWFALGAAAATLAAATHH